MKKILITGGCGFVGRHLVKRLSEFPENELTIIDDLSTGLPQENWPSHLQCDIDRIIIDDCIKYFEKSNERYDVIFHLAAVVEGRLTIEHNPLRVARDLMIDAAMFQWAVRTKPRKIVYFSSSAAYPVSLQTRDNNIALKENMLDVRNGTIGVPDMSYGWAKLTGEFLSHLAVDKHGLKVAIYRPFSGYGEDQALTYPLPSIVKQILESEDGVIRVWGSSDQSRDFIYIEDCIDAILATYEGMNNAEVLNLGNGIETSFKKLVTVVCNVLGKKCKIKPLLNKPEGVFARYCDVEKQKKLGITHKTSLKEGIGAVVKYMRTSDQQNDTRKK